MVDNIAADALQARKDRQTQKAAFLNTLLSEIRMRAKNDGNREPNDSDALAVLKKFLKAAQESIQALESSGRDTAQLKEEVALLKNYLPSPLSEVELKKAIDEIVETLPEKTLKNMGQVMAQLKTKYEGRYDGKVASHLVRQALQG